MTSLLLEPGARLQGELRVPGDKSISHRAVMLGALADSPTRVEGFLRGADALHTLAAFAKMGVPTSWQQDGVLLIDGVGIEGLRASDTPLDLGNAGTAMRLMTGLLAGQSFASDLTGDESLNARPMRRVADPLREMGAAIRLQSDGTPPVHIEPVERLTALHYTLPVASAQVKSALLLAALYAQGETVIREPAPTRDHTERMLRAFGYQVADTEAGKTLRGGSRLTGQIIQVPADISSAAFFLVAASIAGHADVVLRDVGINPTRDGVLAILRLMGADIDVFNKRTWGAEPVADLRVRNAKLHGVDIPRALVPLAIDEFPALLVAAACASGVTRLTGAAELRVKESDRIGAMADALQALGASAEPHADGMIVHGGSLCGGQVQSRGDHRIGMAMAVAATVAAGPVTIADSDNIATSYPGFVEQAATVGMRVQEVA
ncbi:MAG: 3-phosphoshikimate 1-carboxyvinyltransferase [Gammaproteobacteria bacterium]|nr:3-phosphoshikimate 1-carboxyvinyltransferase [Gammaproteobacteria bacterium]